jgi:hypothetical protein
MNATRREVLYFRRESISIFLGFFKKSPQKRLKRNQVSSPKNLFILFCDFLFFVIFLIFVRIFVIFCNIFVMSYDD